MSVFVEIIIMLLILGGLVAIHEAGHLATAKIFKVYCFEYSIGMGPAVLHKKKANGETYFSVRAIPFGGYVSMYGEAEAVELGPGEILPPENRSLEHIAKWKKVIILFAGVFLNFLLGLLLIFISVSCFRQYSYGNGYRAEEDTIVFAPVDFSLSEYTASEINAKKPSEINLNEYQLFLGLTEYRVNGETYSIPRIVSTDAVISGRTGSGDHYIAVYSPSTLTSTHSLLDDLYFFKPIAIDGSELTLVEPYSNLGINKLPDINEMQNNCFQFTSGNSYYVSMTLNFCPIENESTSEVPLSSTFVSVKYDNIEISNSGRTGLDLKIIPISYKNNWSQAVDEWEYYVPYCCTAIAKGFLSLFSAEGLSNLSGVVGMTAMVGTYSAMGGASMLFLFAGLISINLAFFNLIPFPGLDGYQILVTCIEGITKKKVPNKVKAIVSYIGLGLLFALMIVITIKDIVTLI